MTPDLTELIDALMGDASNPASPAYALRLRATHRELAARDPLAAAEFAALNADAMWPERKLVAPSAPAKGGAL